MRELHGGLGGFVCFLAWGFFGVVFEQILNFCPEQRSIVFSFFAYFLVLVLIEYEHVHKLLIFLNGNRPGVFEAVLCVYRRNSLLICKVLKLIKGKSN